MNFKIPDTIFGKTEEEMKQDYERAINGNGDDKKGDKNQDFGFKNSNITKSDYIQIPGTEKVISKFELQGYNNLKWDQAHFKLQENGLYMPTPKLFMAHFMNVLDCYKNNKPLFDASGNPISKKEIKDIALHMLKDHIAVYGDAKGAWTWLDAYFEEQNGIMKMSYDHKIQVDSNGNKTLVPQKIEDLECLMEDCYVDLKFNSQGLPIKKFSNQNYNLGKNIYFWFPKNEKVARFYADSIRDNLSCDRDPSNRHSYLGVFGIAQE